MCPILPHLPALRSTSSVCDRRLYDGFRDAPDAEGTCLPICPHPICPHPRRPLLTAPAFATASTVRLRLDAGMLADIRVGTKRLGPSLIKNIHRVITAAQAQAFECM